MTYEERIATIDTKPAKMDPKYHKFKAPQLSKLLS